MTDETQELSSNETELRQTKPATAPEVIAENPEPAKPAGRNPWVLLFIGLILGGLAGYSLRPLLVPAPEPVAEAAPLAAVESSAEINQAEPHREVMMAVIANARHFYGDPNAPVTLVEFGDFNCGYCGKWAKETLPQIDENYIKTGKVRMAYVHYPILGADSMTAAEAAECAAVQDHTKFWNYHNLLYANQGIGYTEENLLNMAGEMDLDITAFETCLDNFPDRASLEDDIRLAQVMGVRGTPAFLVNGVPLAGAYPYEDFVNVIEGTLAGDY
jgi:protein-disulfide isomerase